MNKVRVSIVLVVLAMLNVALLAHSDKEKAKTESVPEAFRSQVNEAVKAYFNLEKAIFNGDLELAHSRVTELEETISTIRTAGLSASLMPTWKVKVAEILEAAGNLAVDDDITLVRGDFLDISNAFVDIVKNYGPLDNPIYLYHCPMALNTGGHWLSDTKDVANPYFGEEMPGCGTLVETY